MNKYIRLAVVCAVGAALYFGVRALYFRPAFSAGEEAPALQATLHDGRAFDLSRLRGRYVLLDFWGSWCGPCITSFPDLKNLYATYNQSMFNEGRGFEIVSVAIEKDSTRWQQALARYQPTWQYQILDQSGNLRFFNGEISKSFGVKQLPTKYFIGPQGNVIAVNWDIDQIRGYLEKERVSR